MLTLSEVRGQDRVVSILQHALRYARVPQAYLFAGPSGCGKHTTALALAKALNCEKEAGVGCHDCNSCQKIDKDKHPDVRVLRPEGKVQRIPIDTIRKQVAAALAMPPHEGKSRVFLIEEAASMPGPTANALLKTLEEPPPNTHFLLGCVAPMQLLPTIRSRCQRINFQPLTAQLQAEFRGDEDEAGEIRSLCADIIRVSDSRGLACIVDLAKSGSERTILLAALKQVCEHWHLCARSLAMSGELLSAQVYGQRAKEVLTSLLALQDHNAHGQLALEHLLIAMRGMPIPKMPLATPVSRPGYNTQSSQQ